MPPHRSNRLLMPPPPHNPRIKLAHMPLRMCPMKSRHHVGSLRVGPLEIPVYILASPAIAHLATTSLNSGNHPRIRG